jgi:small basic protein
MLLGTIKPLYKNKGNKNDLKTFRPITILSCLDKLFTAILNNRLNTYSESFLLLNVITKISINFAYSMLCTANTCS